MRIETDIKIYWFLLPLAYLFQLGVSIRNYLFDKGILHSQKFSLPVVCVGNLTIGGTGKTPHTEYLVRLLKDKYKVAVLSRGYKRKSKGFVLATPGISAETIGDEPCQMARKFPEVYVAADADRCHGIRLLTDGHTAPGTEAVVLDDAYQHRYVQAGLNLLLINYHRPVFADSMLPAGKLREPVSGKKRAQIIIVTKCPANLSQQEKEEWCSRIAPQPGQQIYFTTLVYGKPYSLSGEETEHDICSLTADKHVLLLTGIASPQPIEYRLRQYTRNIVALTFADHHDFDAADLKRIQDAFGKLPEKERLIITTEKDAARLTSKKMLPPTLEAHTYVLPVSIAFLYGEEDSFNKKIIEYVRKNSRNSQLPAN